LRKLNISTAISKARTIANSLPVFQLLFLQGREDGLTELAAVVFTVTVVVAVPPAESVTEGELKLQVDPVGRPAEHAKVTVPEKPLTELTVRVELPDDPGAETGIVDGLIDEM
jgi:hypothetical protein